MSSLLENAEEIYVIQTLYDGKWRLDKKFDTCEQAQKYASLLVPDWGKARVRLLVGRYDEKLARRRYFEMSLIPPSKWHEKLISRLSGITPKASTGSGIKAGPLIGIVSVLFGALLYSAVTSFPSTASTEGRDVLLQTVAVAPATDRKSIRQAFADLTKIHRHDTQSHKEVPLRLRGDWSSLCASGVQDVMISKATLTEFDGAIAKDIDLKEVYQAGQFYGLVRKTGAVDVVEMAFADQIKLIGQFSADGEYTAISKKNLLNRCF